LIRLLAAIGAALSIFALLVAAAVLLLPPAPEGVVIFVLVILMVIFFHELGHFATAKWFGIKVEEFFIGFGPRVWSFRRGETEYGLKAIPAGGYVRIAGMNPYEEPAPEDLPRTFHAAKPWKRAVVLVAGSVTHFILAFLLLSVFFGAVGVPRARVDRVQLLVSGDRSPASEAGIRAGDEIRAVDGRPVTWEEFLAITRGGAGRQMTVTVAREGTELDIPVTPRAAEVDGERVGRLGIIVGEGSRLRLGPLAAVGRGAGQVGEISVGSVRAMGQIFSPSGVGRIVDQLFSDQPRQVDRDAAGVVGAARLSGQAVAAGAWEVLFFLFAGFNIFVGILNLLPLPPLDGGHLAVVAIEKITRRRVDVRKLMPLTAAVVAFLLLFFVSLLYLDVVRPIPDPFR